MVWIIVTHLTAHVFEIRFALPGVSKRTVHLLECLGCIVPGNALRLNIIEQVLDKVDFWVIPSALFVLLMTQVYKLLLVCSRVNKSLTFASFTNFFTTLLPHLIVTSE